MESRITVTYLKDVVPHVVVRELGVKRLQARPRKRSAPPHPAGARARSGGAAARAPSEREGDEGMRREAVGGRRRERASIG